MPRLLALFLALALAVPAIAAPSPAEILSASHAALSGADTLRCNIVASANPDLRASDLIIRASLVADLNSKSEIDGVRIDAKMSGDAAPRGARMMLIAGPEGGQLLDYVTKTETRFPFEELATHDDAQMLFGMCYWLMLYSGSGMSDPTAHEGDISYVGQEREGREICDVVRIVDGPTTADFYVSQRTSFPERVDFNQDGQTFSVRLSNLRLNVPTPESTFQLARTPRGFREAGDAAGPGGGKNDRPSKKSDANVGVQEGDTAPDWTLADPKGKPHSLSDYRGELVLMDFWATWCPPCRRAMPGLQKLHEEYASQGLNVIGVNAREENPDEAVGYMKSKRFDYQLLLRGDSVFDRFGCKSLPTFFLIDQEGTILYRQSGFSPRVEDKLEDKIREALGLGKKEFDPDNMTPEEIEDYEDF